MGEDLFSFVLSDINGIPALPVFIGNYLLDLLSTFFPIFILLSAFVMLYTGLTRGGDWKSTGQQLAPTAISIAVVMGLLSMKTPYSGKDGGDLGGAFWQDTNSYTVVEMMNTFLGFGNIFADALTHKIIYGNIDVKNGNTSYDGYFPAVLQAMIDKDKSGEIKEFLLKTAKREDIVKKVDAMNSQIATSTKTLVSNLHNLGIVDDFRRVRGTFENTGTDVGAYKNVEINKYIGECSSLMTATNICAYYSPAQFSTQESGSNNVNNVDANGGYKRSETCNLENNFCKKSFYLDVEINNESEGSNKDRYVVDLNKYLEKYGNGGSGSASPRAIPEESQKDILSYINKNNFEQEGNILAITSKLLDNYKSVYDAYNKEYTTLKSKADGTSKKSEKELIYNTMKPYEGQMNQLKAQIDNVASLYKDYQTIFNVLNGTSPMLNVSSIDSVMGSGYYANVKPNLHFSQEEMNKIYEKKAILSLKEVSFWPTINSVLGNQDNNRKIIKSFNSMMKAKVYISVVMYDKFKSVLQDDALFQTAMGFESKATFNRVF